jgi:hypothetical protein
MAPSPEPSVRIDGLSPVVVAERQNCHFKVSQKAL